MRFLENGPSIPDDLLIARDAGDVIFFCGAGVSRHRARLPDFLKLGGDVIDLLGAGQKSLARKLFRRIKELGSIDGVGGLVATDRIFSLLEREFEQRDVQNAVARAIKPTNDPDLSAHKTLIDLSRGRDGTLRLVTTNFDLLFEAAAPGIVCYGPPVLPDPRGAGFGGIVHLHGCVNANYSGPGDKEFIVSSADFGRAYLSDGWATRFMQSLIARYQIVFVGYGADDPPVQYLLEALNLRAGNRSRLFAFQPGSNADDAALWEHRGVRAIPFDNSQGYDPLWDSLTAWAARARDVDGWYARLAGEVEQLELRLDEVLANIAASGGVDDAEDEAASAKAPEEKARRRGRKPLPDSLPRRDIEHLPVEGCACRSCGGALRKVGEDVTEILEYRPGRFEVVRHVRPAFSCRSCEAMTQAPMPSLPIERGRPGPGLLAHVLVSKYCDHLPLYRQSEIYARDSLDLPRGLLAGWVGRSAALAEPMAAYIGRHALAGPRVHADDTPMPMLSPGRGRTQAARFWAYLRDDRPFGGTDPPAVLYEFTPDRKGEHPQRRLRDFQGILQADAYSGFNALYESGRVVEAACWTHARRYFHDELLANGSPLAREAIERMQPLFALEAEIQGQPPEARLAARQARAAPVMADLHAWLEATLRRISGKSDLAKAIRYTLAQWGALTTVLRDGRACLHNNAAERRMRPLALGRKNYLFAGSLEGGRRAAIIYTLVGTAELNGWDPQAYLRVLLDRIADHPINRIGDLAPWNLRPDTA